jgi:hypothetical protein
VAVGASNFRNVFPCSANRVVGGVGCRGGAANCVVGARLSKHSIDRVGALRLSATGGVCIRRSPVCQWQGVREIQPPRSANYRDSGLRWAGGDRVGGKIVSRASKNAAMTYKDGIEYPS